MVGLQTASEKEIEMSELLTATATRPPAFRDRDREHTGQTDAAAERRRARLWTVIEALAYAGAYIDPSGILAVQRLRQAQEEERRGAQN
jgi:hypothetical protein